MRALVFRRLVKECMVRGRGLVVVVVVVVVTFKWH